MNDVKNFSDVSVCVIGVGAIGSMHTVNLLNLGISKVFIVDNIRPKLLKERVEYYSDISELPSEDLDYAIIAVPTSLHEDIIAQITKLFPKINILCEKPLSYDLASSLEILNSKPDIKVGFVERFHKPFEKLVEWHNAQVGPVDVRISRRTSRPSKGHWLLDNNQPGSDILLDLGIHDIDFLMQMKKQLPDKISNHIAKMYKESFTLEFSDGSSVQLEFGWDLDKSHPYGIENVVELKTSKSSAQYKSLNEELKIDGKYVEIKPRFMYSYTKELVDLFGLDTKKSKFPSKEEIVLTMKCIELIRKDKNE